MKAQYKTADGHIMFEVTGETPKSVFEQIASIQEVFEAEPCCGICKGSEQKGIRFRVRNVETSDGKKVKYYELWCLQCFARFQFGQAQEGGGLFPKRKSADGKPLPNRGWEKYERRPAPGSAEANGRPTLGSVAANPPIPPRSVPVPQQYEYAAGITDDDVPF